MSLSGATNYFSNETTDDKFHYRSWGQSAVITLNTNNKTSLWIEAYAALPQESSGTQDSYYGDVGALYLISTETQLDLRVGSKLQDRFGQDIFAGAGISVRWERG